MYGKNGYYLASPGSVTWDDLYEAMATALAKQKAVDDDKVVLANDDNLQAMAAALGVSKEFVGVSLGGKYVSRREFFHRGVFSLF